MGLLPVPQTPIWQNLYVMPVEYILGVMRLGNTNEQKHIKLYIYTYKHAYIYMNVFKSVCDYLYS